MVTGKTRTTEWLSIVTHFLEKERFIDSKYKQYILHLVSEVENNLLFGYQDENIAVIVFFLKGNLNTSTFEMQK